jgi:hypothetical protein
MRMIGKRLALAVAMVVLARLAWRQKPVRRATYASILWIFARVTPDIFDRAVAGVAERRGRNEAELRAKLARHGILRDGDESADTSLSSASGGVA